MSLGFQGLQRTKGWPIEKFELGFVKKGYVADELWSHLCHGRGFKNIMSFYICKSVLRTFYIKTTLIGTKRVHGLRNQANTHRKNEASTHPCWHR